MNDFQVSSTQGLQASSSMQKRSPKHQHEHLDLPEGTKLFINESLCPYYEGSLGYSQKNAEQEKNTFLFYC